MTTIPIPFTCFPRGIRIRKPGGGLAFLFLLLLSFLLTAAAVCAEGQPGLLDLKQREQDTEIIQKPQEPTISPPPGPGKKETAPSGPRKPLQPSGTTQGDKAALQRAWQLYKRGDDAGALPLFRRVSGSSQRSMALEAKLGLAYVYLRQGEQQRARGLFEELVKQKYRVREVLPSLLPLLLLDGDDERAKPYLVLLPDDERSAWTKKFKEVAIRKEWQQVMASGNPQTLDQFAKRHQDDLEGCLANDLFLQIADRLLAAEWKKEAASIYHTLLTCVADDWETRLGIVHALSAALPEEEVHTLISEEKKRGGSSAYQRELFLIDMTNLKKRLGSLEPNSPEAETVARQILSLDPEDLSARRALAWSSYNRGDYGEAYALFSVLQKQHPGERDIALGLVYSGLQIGKTKEVLAFVDKVDFPDAEWQKARVQVYLKGAGESYTGKEYEASEKLLTKVLTLEPENANAKSLLGWVYYAEGRDEDALALVREARGRTSTPNDTLAQLSSLDSAIQSRKGARVPPPLPTTSPHVDKVAEEAPSPQPEDLSARRALAWASYNRGDYGEAYALFSVLQEQHPGERDIALGLVYSGLQIGKTKEVLAFVEKVDFPDPEWQKARVQAYLKRAGEGYASKEYGESEKLLTKVLTLEPENADAKSLLGWVYYAEGKDEKALTVFLDQYETRPSLDAAQAILSVYDRQGERQKAFRFSESMKTSNLSALDRTSADFFYSHDAPIRAAQTCGDPDTCYYNADKASVETLGGYRSKSGDDGFSRLEEWSFPVTLSMPVGFGKRWTFSLIPTYLSSGSAGPSPYAGNYYRNLDGAAQRHTWETSLWGWRPEAGYEVEGPVKYGFLLGTSLLGTPISPVPTFDAGASGRNWRVKVHQLQVDESILSYAGERDPYTSREWGRVMKTGAEGEITFDPAPSYWLSVKGGYDYLWGKNVWSNQSIQGTAAFGKTIPLGTGELLPGIFATLKHFEHNTDFFTFGHGGYFSPDLFFMAGPTLRYRTTQCSRFAFDGEVSAGYQYYTTEDSPHYPLLEGSLSSLNAAARSDALGTYRGETESKVGFSGKMRVLKLLANHWILSGFVGSSNSSGFREWQAGMGLQYFFKSIFNVGEFKHFLKGIPPR